MPFPPGGSIDIVAPAATPEAIILRLQQTLAGSELRDQFILREDAEPVGSSAEELARFLRAESAKWAKVIQSVGVKAD